MKRNTVVALVILAALTGLYFAVREQPETEVDSPMTLEKVEGLSRIEITPAPGGSDEEGGGDGESENDTDSDRPDLIAFEKKEGEWWLTRPVESPVADDVAGTLDDAFGSAIRTDDLKLSPDDASTYEVDDPQGVTVALYGKDASSPVHELVVGKQMSVPGTGVERTYVRRAGSKKIYRAQFAIGDFVRKNVGDFRSKTILNLDEASISTLTFERNDGTTIALEKKDGSWTIARPEVDFEIDEGEVQSIVGALASLNASGFASDQDLSALGLKEPTVRLTVSTGDSESTLLLGRVEGNKEPMFHVKKPDEPFKYELSTYTGEKLDAMLTDVRSKTPRSFDKEAITRVEFPGDNPPFVVEKSDDGSWAIVRPEETEESLNTSKLDGHLSTIAEPRVTGFPDIDPREAGVVEGAEKIQVEMQGNSYTIRLGKTVEGSEDRYMKFDDQSEMYTISKHVARQLTPSVEDVTGETQKPTGGPGNMGGPGMGKGMNKMQKMRMMKKLKQRMRQRQGQ
jgi:hypothetical protein